VVGAVDRGRDLVDRLDAASVERTGLLLIDGLQERDVAGGPGLVSAAALVAAAAALAQADGLVDAGIGGSEATVLAEEVEDSGWSPILEPDDVAGTVVDLERGGRRAGGELVEIAVDLELCGDAGVAR